MGDYIVFNPGSIIFYCFGVVIPTIMLLYSFGHMVFTVGEYKESDRTIPIIILLLVIKLFIIGFVMFSIYHILFDYNIHEISLTSIIIFVWGLLITFDTWIGNRVLLMIDRYKDDKCCFKHYLKCICQKTFKHNPTVFYGKLICVGILTLGLIGSLFIKTHETINVIEILFMLYFWINYKIFRYIRHLQEITDECCNKNKQKPKEDGK